MAAEKGTTYYSSNYTDIYSLMRSQEMQDYARECLEFTPREQMRIAWNSFNPIRLKQRVIEDILEKATEEEDILYIKEMLRFIKCLIDTIEHPDFTAVYAADYFGYRKMSVLFNQHDISFFSTYQQFIQWCSWEGDTDEYVELSLVPAGDTGESGREIEPPLIARMARFDYELQVYDFVINESYFQKMGFETLLSDLDSSYSYWPEFIGGFLLPFPAESRVKLQTPFMEEPVYGGLNYSVDGNGCIYMFLVLETDMDDFTDEIDLTVLKVEWEFSVFDFLSSAEGEVPEEVLQRIRYGDKEKERYTDISRLKDGEHTFIRGELVAFTEVDVELADLHAAGIPDWIGLPSLPKAVIVQDDTGSIVCVLRAPSVRRYSKVLQKISENSGKILMDGWTCTMQDGQRIFVGDYGIYSWAGRKG